MTASRETGSMLPAVSLWLAAAVLGCLLVAGVGDRAATRARAQAAADAAALAGAGAGEGAARQITEINGAALEHYVVNDGRVTVRVRIGDTVAQASAERQIRPRSPG